jgi:hypothetical protein
VEAQVRALSLRAANSSDRTRSVSVVPTPVARASAGSGLLVRRNSARRNGGRSARAREPENLSEPIEWPRECSEDGPPHRDPNRWISGTKMSAQLGGRTKVLLHATVVGRQRQRESRASPFQFPRSEGSRGDAGSNMLKGADRRQPGRGLGVAHTVAHGAAEPEASPSSRAPSSSPGSGTGRTDGDPCREARLRRGRSQDHQCASVRILLYTTISRFRGAVLPPARSRLRGDTSPLCAIGRRYRWRTQLRSRDGSGPYSGEPGGHVVPRPSAPGPAESWPAA